jgi:hypothetical protein
VCWLQHGFYLPAARTANLPVPETPLLGAAASGNTRAVEELLKAGAFGLPAVMFPLMMQKRETFSVRRRRGDLQERDKTEATTLMWVVYCEDADPPARTRDLTEHVGPPEPAALYDHWLHNHICTICHRGDCLGVGNVFTHDMPETRSKDLVTLDALYMHSRELLLAAATPRRREGNMLTRNTIPSQPRDLAQSSGHTLVSLRKSVARAHYVAGCAPPCSKNAGLAIPPLRLITSSDGRRQPRAHSLHYHVSGLLTGGKERE